MGKFFSYQQNNGFKPAPLDTHEIVLDEKMNPLIDALAKNTHNVWAREKIGRGWTYGVSEVRYLIYVCRFYSLEASVMA